MTTTNKRFSGPAQLGATPATLYTCPALTIAVVRHIHVSNPDSVDHTFTLSIGADAAGTRVFAAETVTKQSSKDYWGPYTLAAGEVLQASASVAATLVMEIDGTEFS